MSSNSPRECYIYITLPGKTAAVTAGKFVLDQTSSGNNFVQSFPEDFSLVLGDSHADRHCSGFYVRCFSRSGYLRSGTPCSQMPHDRRARARWKLSSEEEFRYGDLPSAIGARQPCASLLVLRRPTSDHRRSLRELFQAP